MALHKLENAAQSSILMAYRHCSRIARTEAGNFYYAFIFLPAVKRRGIEALYAFCRKGDDITDGSQARRPDEIGRLEERLDQCYLGYYSDSLTLALADAVRKFAFERSHFNDLLLGLVADLTVHRYPTFDDLQRYCYLVASTVGLLCLKIFGCDTAESRRYAENLGIALQLTNILRDLKEDYDRGRIYLPQSDLERFELGDGDLFSSHRSENLKRLVRWEAERAGNYFADAEDVFPYEFRRNLLPARIMGAIYRRLLARILGLDSFERRIDLPRREKIAIGLKLWAFGGM